jgi:hypothetical protein
MATKSQTPREPTFSLEALNKIVGEQVLQALAAQRAEFEASVLAANKAAKDKIDYDSLAIKAFRKAGFGEVKPRTDVLTYNKWLEAGFRVKPGEHAIKVRQLRLFHRSQVEAITAAEKKEATAKLAAKAVERTADRLPKPSPISAPVVPVKTSEAKGRKVVPIQTTA